MQEPEEEPWFKDGIPMIDPLILADPLAPGYYLPAAYKWLAGQPGKGRLCLKVGLAVYENPKDAMGAAKSLARYLEEEDPLP